MNKTIRLPSGCNIALALLSLVPVFHHRLSGFHGERYQARSSRIHDSLQLCLCMPGQPALSFPAMYE